MFSDESKERGYRMAAVVVRSANVAQVRRDCKTWAARGSRRFHARKESDRLRKEALGALGLMGDVLSIVIVENNLAVEELVRRETVLCALAGWACENGVARWVIERDLSVEKFDRRVLSEFRRSTTLPEFEYLHLAGTEDPILWAADLAAWAWTKGGQYAAKVKPLISEHIRL